MIAFIVYFRKRFRADAIRKEFIRQIAINDRHRVRLYSNVMESGGENVEIDYANLIGKGAQSIVYQRSVSLRYTIRSK